MERTFSSTMRHGILVAVLGCSGWITLSPQAHAEPAPVPIEAQARSHAALGEQYRRDGQFALSAQEWQAAYLLQDLRYQQLLQERHRERKLWKNPWFWGVIAGATVTSAVCLGVGLGIGLRQDAAMIRPIF